MRSPNTGFPHEFSKYKSNANEHTTLDTQSESHSENKFQPSVSTFSSACFTMNLAHFVPNLHNSNHLFLLSHNPSCFNSLTPWIIDIGATNHMVNSASFLTSITSIVTTFVKFPNGNYQVLATHF